MKKNIIALVFALFSSTFSIASPMTYNAMCDNARFLTDRMIYTLGLSENLIDELYLINYDYICGVNDFLDEVAYGYHYDDYMEVMEARDRALRRLLSAREWRRLKRYDYFYRPIRFADYAWSFTILVNDLLHDRYYYSTPRRYREYRGGHYFVGMRSVHRPLPPHPVHHAAPGHGPAHAPHVGRPAHANPAPRHAEAAPRNNAPKDNGRVAPRNKETNHNVNTNKPEKSHDSSVTPRSHNMGSTRTSTAAGRSASVSPSRSSSHAGSARVGSSTSRRGGRR